MGRILDVLAVLGSLLVVVAVLVERNRELCDTVLVNNLLFWGGAILATLATAARLVSFVWTPRPRLSVVAVYLGALPLLMLVWAQVQGASPGPLPAGFLDRDNWFVAC